MSKKNISGPMQPSGRRYDYTALCLAGNAELENVMRMGVQPELKDLAGWEFRGFNTLEVTSLLGIRKFKKGFYQEDPSEDISKTKKISGYNVQVVQTALGDDWFAKIRNGATIKHGWYDCYPVKLTEVDCKYPNSVLINYACARNPAWDPSKKLRDYLVQVYPDNRDLFLGKAYVALAGPIRLFVSYFVLERMNESPL